MQQQLSTAPDRVIELVRGTSCVVLRLYFKGSYVKAEIGLGRGRKQHDKRQVVRLRDLDREVARDSTGRDGTGRGGRGGGR